MLSDSWKSTTDPECNIAAMQLHDLDAATPGKCRLVADRGESCDVKWFGFTHQHPSTVA